MSSTKVAGVSVSRPEPGPGRGGAPSSADPVEPAIRLVNVKKAFTTDRRQQVLDGLSLDIPAGRTTVILGPSGCGKSVMLKHIVGLLKPDAGEIYVLGTRIDTFSERQLKDVRLKIGLVFQMAALFDSMSVEDNVAFPLAEHTRMSREERHERVIECLRVVDMLGFENRLPSELSGGQRKRVALARAIVMKPSIVLYDEPTTGLDPIRADGINDLIIKLNRELGVTGLVVTHDLSSARKVSDKAAILFHGKVAAEGTYQDLENNPDPHIQQFLAGGDDLDDGPRRADDSDDA